ncbi:MAG TPA: hypothetical protein VHZ54_12000 [Solirubrobacterales bacterium]|jgi:hypothetical protein|nr:hypothetical protein [Solirubrobacterales bacterium]
MLIGTDLESAGGPGRLRRWLRADLADLIDVDRSGGVAAGQTDRDGRRKGSGSPDQVASAGTATFDRDLKALRRRIVRRWALAVAARYALVALAVALVPAALAAFGAIGWIWAIVVPVALFVVALVARLARPPSLTQVARLLDDRLGLFDVTATALQFERSGAPVEEGPAAPVFAEAAALLRAGASAWRPHARSGGRELATAGALIVGLAVIAVVGSSSGGSGTKATAIATAPGRAAHPAAGGANNVSPPLTRPKAKRKAAGPGPPANQEKRSPYGIYDYGYEGKKALPRLHQARHAGLYEHGVTPSGKGAQQLSANAPGEANEAREKAEEEAANAAAKSTAGKKEQSGGSAPQSLKSLTGGKAPPSGSVQPLPNADSGAKPQAGGQGGSPSSSNAPGGRSDSESPSRQGGGRPSGSKTAGGQRASLANGTKGAEGGVTAGELTLKAGFAAVKSGKAASGRGPRNAQGAGGPGKSAGIGGAAFEEAEAGSLGYVPPDAGVAPTLDPGLFNRYLNALTAIAGRHW